MRVLVVDDEEGIREFAAEALETEGHEVETAADGAEALAKVRSQGFDIVLTDLKMPKVDGMTLVRELAATQPDVEVIVLTAHGSVDGAVEAMKLGAFDYLEKPIASLAAFRLLVARAAERRRLRAHASAARRGSDDGTPLTFGDPVMVPVIRAVDKVAPTTASVLLIGESGTGKEVLARAIHARSARAGAPFVAINCAAVTDTLLESELFGHEKGAFTGATEARQGRLEVAAGGTFFLDEIGELKLELQAKLLRVLQEKVFERVGGTRTLAADVRWIAATNRDLPAMIAAGRFREDLYHRLAVFPISLPPLRERKVDLEPLAVRLLAAVGAELGKPSIEMSPEAMAFICQQPWTGNVRELKNALERGVILSDGVVLRATDLALNGSAAAGPDRGAGALVGEGASLAELERAAIIAALERHGGNRKEAAAELGIGVRTLYEKLKRYDID